MGFCFIATYSATVLVAQSAVAVDHSDRLKELLSTASLTTAVDEFGTVVQKNPDDHQAKVALGLVQFMQAVEQLAQQNYKFGLFDRTFRGIPGAQMPVPINETPTEIRYEDYRSMIKSFRIGISRAESTLAAVDTSQELKLKFYIGQAMLDIDGDNKVTQEESLGVLFAGMNRRGERLDLKKDPDVIDKFYVGVDGADVHWLRGYCNLLMAMDDIVLAYDEQDLFERCAHLFYPKISTPYAFLDKESSQPGIWDARRFADIIAFIHSVDFELIDADRMRSAHAQLLEMLHQSRQCWKLALAEQDDDQEWIPNPKQAGVIRLRVNQQQVNGWAGVIDEAEAILQGEKLIPFWRKYSTTLFNAPQFPEQGTGINLKSVFYEPRDFDLVLFLTGTDSAPYLEDGPLSTPETWSRLERAFDGQFFFFALWLN